MTIATAAPLHPQGSKRMWVLIYIFSYSSVPPLRTTGRSGDGSNVVFQEFKRGAVQGVKVKNRGDFKGSRGQVEKRLGRFETSRRG